jgi:peptidoglycan/LPS O-acetylase OafA/YrhL
MDQLQKAQPKPSRRIVELDVLRALAAINLVLFHFTHVYSVKYGYSTDLGFEFAYGKYGVSMFFMLSGFVNALTILRKRQPREFVASRIIRIIPSYYLVIGMNLVLLTMLPMSGFYEMYSAEQVVANLTILPNLFGQSCMEPVTWTLQIEILFYGLILFMFISGALRDPLKMIFWYLSLCMVGIWSIEYLAVNGGNESVIALLSFLRQLLILDYMPLFFMGMLAHQIWKQNGNLKWNLIGICLSGIVFHIIDRHDYNPVATVLMVGILFLSAYGKLPFLRLKPLVFVSTISYSLYLLHNNLGCAFIYQMEQLGLSPMTSLVIGIVFVTIVSTVVTFWIERPISAQLRKLWNWIKATAQSRGAGTGVINSSKAVKVG